MLMSWLIYFDCLGDPRYRSSVFTADYVERVLQSVFQTITVVAVYEIVKETFRRIEVIRLRYKVRKYETMIQNCCVRMYGCQTCYNRNKSNCPTLTYRSVPPSVFKSLGNKVVLWKAQKLPECYSKSRSRGDSREEIRETTRYLSDLTMYMRELGAEQDYELKESLRKHETMRKRREEEMLLNALRDQQTCPCAAVRSPCNRCSARPAHSSFDRCQ